MSFASTTGASVAFLLSRYFFRDAVERRFGERLSGFNESLRREGAFYLFALRLIPAVPFFVINLVMGLTSMRVATFWWVSQLGMLAGTAVYVYAGSRVPSLRKLADEGTRAVFTVVARNAGDMICEITLAMTHNIGLKKIGETIHPYPTQSEAVRKIADQFNRTRLTPLLRSAFGQ